MYKFENFATPDDIDAVNSLVGSNGDEYDGDLIRDAPTVPDIETRLLPLSTTSMDGLGAKGSPPVARPMYFENDNLYGSPVSTVNGDVNV